jgi:hypothetical protein
VRACDLNLSDPVQVYPTQEEAIGIARDTVTDVAQISEQVRKEQIETEGDTGR